MFKSGRRRVKEAAEMFDEQLYGRLARRLREESEGRRYEKGEFYASQAIYRDAEHKNLPCQVAGLRVHGCIYYYQYIKVGKNVFEVAKVDGSINHVYYRLAETIQLDLVVGVSQ